MRAGRQLGIVGHEDEGRPLFLVELGHELDHARAGGGVEVARGLVGEKQLRAMNEGAGQRHALLLTARQLGRFAPALVRHAERSEGVVDGRITLRRARQGFETAHGRTPTLEELAAATELDPRAVAKALETVEASVSLNQAIHDGDGEFGDLFADRVSDDPVESAMESTERELVRDALALLPERERLLLELRFGFSEGSEELTLDGVGEKLGITRERVRQLEKRAMGRLKHLLRASGDPPARAA